MDLIIPRRSSYCPNFATAPFRSRGRTGRTTGIGSTPTSSRRARVLGIYAIGLDGCMTEEHKNVFGYIHDSMKEPSEKKRQWGMVLVQSGLPVMFLASSGGELDALAVLVEKVGYVSLIVGFALFFVGIGGRRFEKRRLLAGGGLAVLLVILASFIPGANFFAEASHGAQLFWMFAAQFSSLAFVQLWETFRGSGGGGADGKTDKGSEC